MPLSNAERQAVSRAKKSGYEGQPCPIAKADYTSEGLRLTVAWAQGVWARQGEEEDERRRRFGKARPK
jgi:hypothetical protein